MPVKMKGRKAEKAIRDMIYAAGEVSVHDDQQGIEAAITAIMAAVIKSDESDMKYSFLEIDAGAYAMREARGANMKPEKKLGICSVRNGKPAHYLTEITLNYCRVRRFAGYTKEEARARLAKLRIAAKQGKLEETVMSERPKDIFGEYARAVLDSAEWKAKRSARRNETSFQNLNREFKDCRPVDIKPGAVRRNVTRRLEASSSPASANRELSLLKSLLYMAEADEVIPANPIRGRRVKKQPENNHREKIILALDLTDDKLRVLVDAAVDYLKPILKLAITTGMRCNESLRAKWKDINIAIGKLRIPAENAKSKRERYIDVDPGLCAELDSLARNGDYIFLNPETGRRIKDVRSCFKAACRAAGIETGLKGGIVFHDLRHVAASHLVKVVDIVTASKILGHSTLDQTLRYVCSTDTDRRAAVCKVYDNLFRGCQKDVNALEPASPEGLENRAQIN